MPALFSFPVDKKGILFAMSPPGKDVELFTLKPGRIHEKDLADETRGGWVDCRYDSPFSFPFRSTDFHARW
jgi:hypothetical protein